MGQENPSRDHLVDLLRRAVDSITTNRFPDDILDPVVQYVKSHYNRFSKDDQRTLEDAVSEAREALRKR